MMFHTHLASRLQERLISEPVRLYRVTLKSGARGLVEATNAISAWKQVVGSPKLIARVEVMREKHWVELEGVV